MNEMNEMTLQCKIEATKATRKYLDSLNKDFSDYAGEFRKSLNDLLENGKTDDGYFCLLDAKVEQQSGPIFFAKDFVQCALQTLKNLTKDNAEDVMNHIQNMNPNFLLFSSFSKMKKLEFRISKCKEALRYLH